MNLRDKLSWANAYIGKHVVYQLTWGGKEYVGSSGNLLSRLYWWRSDDKVQREEVEVKVLSVHTSEEERLEAEHKAILKLNPAHNKTPNGKAGGVPGRVVSPETGRKISAAKMGHAVSDETRHKQRQAKLGKRQSAATIAARAASNTGKIRSAEQRARISESVLGKSKSESHKAALSAAWIRRKQNTSIQNERNVRHFAFGATV